MLRVRKQNSPKRLMAQLKRHCGESWHHHLINPGLIWIRDLSPLVFIIFVHKMIIGFFE